MIAEDGAERGVLGRHELEMWSRHQPAPQDHHEQLRPSKAGLSGPPVKWILVDGNIALG
jgi:hypothetical protein